MIRDFYDIDLSGRNSFHVRQRAARLVEFETTDDLTAFFRKGAPAKWTVLAGGNNILFTQDFDGVLLTPRAASIDVVAETPDAVAVRAEAGVEWDDLVAWAVERDLWGIENLSLIPGKVGAAPVQNIGAYGAEAKDAIESVEMFCTDTCNTLILSREHCAFGYRESVFKHALRGRVAHHGGHLPAEPPSAARSGLRRSAARDRGARGRHAAQHPRSGLCDPALEAA